MSKAKLLLQVGRLDEDDVEKMQAAAKTLGVEVCRFKYVPFGGDIEYVDTPPDSRHGCMAYYGTINAAKTLQRDSSWYPLGWMDFEKFMCHSYYPHYGEYLIDPDYLMLPLGELVRRKNSINYLMGDPVFIRPDDNEKTFCGQVVATEHLENWVKYIERFEHLPPLVAVVARYKVIDAEWRLVIYNRQVIAGSQYQRDDMLQLRAGYPPKVERYANKIAQTVEWQPHDIYVMDIAELSDGTYRLIEIGSVNVAGLYESDFKPVLKAMMELAQKEWDEVYD